MFRIAAISVCVGLVSYYIDVKNKDKGKKVSSVRAMRNAFITMIVLGTLYYLKIYMSTDANHINAAAVETTTIVESSLTPIVNGIVPVVEQTVASAITDVSTAVPIVPVTAPEVVLPNTTPVLPSVDDDMSMLQMMKSALNMSRKPKIGRQDVI
jgi:hypothetical protein